MTDKKLKPQPKVAPTTFREYYNTISNPDPYQDEPLEDYEARKQLFETFNLELTRQGLTVDQLAMAELGIEKPSAGSTLLHGLIARI